MRVKNFPGRKNDRRKSALARLGARNGGTPPTQLDRDGLDDEDATLRNRIMPDSLARGIRTKKNRSARAKLTV